MFSWFQKRHKLPLVDNVENEVEDGGQAGGHKCGLSAGGGSECVVVVGRNNVVGIGRDGELPGGEFLLKRELVGDEFLLERVLELESLSIPDLHRFVVTGTHKNTPVGGV